MRSIFSYIKYLIFIFGVLCSTVSIAQDFSNKGREFWVGYGSHVSMYNSNGSVNTSNGGSQDMVLYFTSDRDATVTVEIPATGYIMQYPVIANTITTSLPIPKIGNNDARIANEGKYSTGIKITSDVAIIAYAHIYNQNVSGATLLFPTTILANDYYSVNYDQVANNGSRYAYSFAYVIATEDNTEIEIIPSVNTEGGYKLGDTIRQKLNKGEIYNIFGKLGSQTVVGSGINAQYTYFAEDLTGTRIRSVGSSCKKIAVYSGSGKLSISCEAVASSADNNMAQAFPLSAWGMKYVTIPTKDLSYNFFRIIVTDPDTKVFRNGNLMTGLNRDIYYQYQSNTTDKITSDKPIMVAQFITSQGKCNNGSPGDPEMIYLSPIEQTINNITINSTSRYNIVKHYINISINKNFNFLSIDGIDIPKQIFNIHNNDPDILYIQYQLSAGSHTIISDSGFNAIAYGYGTTESYGYNAGANVIDLYQKFTAVNKYGLKNEAITCRGTPFYPTINLPYKPDLIEWNLPNFPIIKVIDPLAKDSTIINGKKVYFYDLPNSYIYTIKDTFDIKINVLNPTSGGCTGIQEINFPLIIIDPPDGNFNFVTNNCITDSVSLSDNTPVGDKPVYKYFWDFGDAKFYDTVPNIKFKPDHEGEYNIRYVVANTIGCLSDTINKLIKIDSAINVNFSISKITCQNKDIEFSDLSKARGVSQMQNWYWDYGDGSKVDSLTASTKMKHQYANLQTFNAVLTVQTLNGCVNSHSVPVVNNPNPQINVQLPEVCLADAAAKFIDLTTIADNSNNKFSYLWNFNDSSVKEFPNPNLLIPNAITAQNPEVKYLSPGKYIVSLRVLQEDTKCVDTARFSFTVNGSYPKPLFYVLKDTALCSNEFVEIRDSSWVDIGSIGKLNIYWGDGSDTTIEEPGLNKIYKHFYKNINAPNNLNLDYTIKINASSGGVCQTAISNSLSIVPPPEFPIITTIKDYLCKSDTLILNVLSKGGAPPFINTWTSENTNASIDNTKSIINGITPGQVEASLKVKDSKNCVYPYPSLAFFNTMLVRDIPTAEILPGDSIICNGDAIIIAGAGRGYDNSAISTYSWYRNDTIVSTLSTNSITNNIPGWYKLTVNDGKCNSVATAAKKVSPLNITKYSFTHVPNICIGVPLIVNTNAVDQYNVHYNWDFGDGFNYLKASPGSHKYMAKGDYKIKVNVTNDYCPKYNYQIIGSTVKVASAIKPTTFKYFFLAKQPFNVVTKTDPGYVQYKWNPATFLDNPNKANPIFNGDKSTDFTLTRTDTISSCSVTDEYEIIVSTEVYANVPNAFTPNNDGLNDVLKVEYSTGIGAEFNFRIFNRWGKLMFQTNDKNKGWDGRDPSGILQEMDGYSYFLEYNYNDPLTSELKNIKKTGSVILFR